MRVSGATSTQREGTIRALPPDRDVNVYGHSPFSVRSFPLIIAMPLTSGPDSVNLCLISIGGIFIPVLNHMGWTILVYCITV